MKRRVEVVLCSPAWPISRQTGPAAKAPEQPLHQGDEFPVTLMFDKAGAVTTTVTVRKAGASMPVGHDAMGGTQMHDMPMQGGQRQ